MRRWMAGLKRSGFPRVRRGEERHPSTRDVPKLLSFPSEIETPRIFCQVAADAGR